MTDYRNGAEGVADGVTVTQGSGGNSGGASGDFFNTITITGAPTIEGSTAQAAHGTHSYHIAGDSGTTAYFRWTSLASGQINWRFYFMFNGSVPTDAQDFFALRSSSTGAMSIGISSGTRLQIKDAAGGTLNSGGWTPGLTADVWYRLEGECAPGASSTTGLITGRMYLGDDETVVSGCDFSSSAANAGTANIDHARMGKITSAATADIYLDSLALGTGSLTPIGPEASSTNVSISALVTTAATSAGTPAVSTTTGKVVGAIVATSSTVAMAPVIGVTTVTSITSTVAASALALAPVVTAKQNTSTAAVVGTATAGAQNPSVSTTRNVSIAAVPAGASASSPNPSNTASKNVTVAGLVTTASTMAPAPSVGLTSSVTISAIVSASLATAQVPGLAIGGGVTISVAGASVLTSAIAPSLTVNRSLSITAVPATASIQAAVPLASLGTGVTVQATLALASAAGYGASVDTNSAVVIDAIAAQAIVYGYPPLVGAIALIHAVLSPRLSIKSNEASVTVLPNTATLVLENS